MEFGEDYGYGPDINSPATPDYSPFGVDGSVGSGIPNAAPGQGSINESYGSMPGGMVNGSIGGAQAGVNWGAALNNLLNFTLARDKIDAQTKVATAGRTVYPGMPMQYGVGGAQSMTGANLQRYAVLAVLAVIGLKMAKVI